MTVSRATSNDEPRMARQYRVIVVDDHLAMAETVADGLVRHGYDAVAFADPSVAAREIERGEHDALVTDLRMEGHDGLDLLGLSLIHISEPTRPY